jgi:hypothetical protein
MASCSSRRLGDAHDVEPGRGAKASDGTIAGRMGRQEQDPLRHETRRRMHETEFAAAASNSRLPVGWWRWGRVELPVQNPSPGTTTSVSDGLSSIARTTIGSLPGDPVTCP